jgi:hypothetical protein
MATGGERGVVAAGDSGRHASGPGELTAIRPSGGDGNIPVRPCGFGLSPGEGPRGIRNNGGRAWASSRLA